MKKFASTLIFGIIFLLFFINTAYAAEAVEVKLEMSETVFNTGDELVVEISAKSNEDVDVMGLGGAVEFNADVFEIVTIDYDTAIEEADSIMATILKEMKKQMQEQGKESNLVYVDEDWCITLVEEQGVYVFAAITISDPIKKSSIYTTIGEMTFNVKSSTSSSTEKISLTNMKATAGSETSTSLEVADASTQSITINAGSAGDMDDIPSLKPNDDSDDENNDEKKENSEAIANTQTADTKAPDAGAEDIVPYAIIIMVIGLFGFVKYNKYRGI